MNIRKRQLKINWTYALGEIIIVIIGITIAFALNNWAENAKGRKTKKVASTQQIETTPYTLIFVYFFIWLIGDFFLQLNLLIKPPLGVNNYRLSVNSLTTIIQNSTPNIQSRFQMDRLSNI